MHLALVADATPENPDPAEPRRIHRRRERNSTPVPDPRPGWQHDALCREVGSEMFFPEKGDQSLVGDARKVCDECPVRDDCRNFGLVHGGRDGVWGGLSQTELQKQRRELGLPHAYIQIDLPVSLFAIAAGEESRDEDWQDAA